MGMKIELSKIIFLIESHVMSILPQTKKTPEYLSGDLADIELKKVNENYKS